MHFYSHLINGLFPFVVLGERTPVVPPEEHDFLLLDTTNFLLLDGTDLLLLES
jgi:hypothetical protein